MTNTDDHEQESSALQNWLLLLYLSFVVYGSLVPLQYVDRPWDDAVQAFRNIPFLTLGIDSRADWVANVFQGAYDYDLSMVSHVEANDFAAFGKPGYYPNYKADALNKLVADLNATTDPAKQISIKQDIQKQLANDFAAIYVFELPNITVANKDVQGLWVNAPQPTTELSAISWAQ